VNTHVEIKTVIVRVLQQWTRNNLVGAVLQLLINEINRVFNFDGRQR